MRITSLLPKPLLLTIFLLGTYAVSLTTLMRAGSWNLNRTIGLSEQVVSADLLRLAVPVVLSLWPVAVILLKSIRKSPLSNADLVILGLFLLLEVGYVFY